MKLLSTLTVRTPASAGPHDFMSTAFCVHKLESGKFQLSARQTGEYHRDDTTHYTDYPEVRFRARGIEELVPLSLGTFASEFHGSVRNVVYDADDAEFADRCKESALALHDWGTQHPKSETYTNEGNLAEGQK
jgi:hypothetical protein